MSAAKTLLICLAVLLFSAVGCRRGAEEKISPAKVVAADLAKADKEADPDEPERSIEPVVKSPGEVGVQPFGAFHKYCQPARGEPLWKSPL